MNIPLQSIISWRVYYQDNVEKIFVLVLLLTGHFLVYHRMVILSLDPRHTRHYVTVLLGIQQKNEFYNYLKIRLQKECAFKGIHIV